MLKLLHATKSGLLDTEAARQYALPRDVDLRATPQVSAHEAAADDIPDDYIAIDPQVRRWIPLVVPLLAAMLACAAMTVLSFA